MGKFKIEDLKLNHEVVLSDKTRGRVICLMEETHKRWNNEDCDFIYITETGEIKWALINEVEEILRIIPKSEIYGTN